MTVSQSASPPSCLFLLILIALAAMATASLHAAIGHVAPAGHGPVATRDAAPAQESGPPASGTAAPSAQGGEMAPGLSEDQADGLSDLMRALKANPNDADALIGIGQTFLEAGEWARAEVFLNRAILNRPADLAPRYMLGIALYQQERFDEARAAYEELLNIREEPAALYNLVILYKYHLNNPDKAGELAQKILASPEADADTRKRAEEELREK